MDAEAGGLAADSLAPRRVGELMFPLAQRHVDRVVLVSDEAIREAQEALWRVLRLVAEPGGAAAFAAVLSGGYRPSEGERVGVVICGGNTTAVDFRRDMTAKVAITTDRIAPPAGPFSPAIRLRAGTLSERPGSPGSRHRQSGSQET